MTHGPLFGNEFPHAVPFTVVFRNRIRIENGLALESLAIDGLFAPAVTQVVPDPKVSAQSGALFPNAPHEPPATPTSTSSSSAPARVDLCVDHYGASSGGSVEVAVAAAYGGQPDAFELGCLSVGRAAVGVAADERERCLRRLRRAGTGSVVARDDRSATLPAKVIDAPEPRRAEAVRRHGWRRRRVASRREARRYRRTRLAGGGDREHVLGGCAGVCPPAEACGQTRDRCLTQHFGVEECLPRGAHVVEHSHDGLRLGCSDGDRQQPAETVHLLQGDACFGVKIDRECTEQRRNAVLGGVDLKRPSGADDPAGTLAPSPE